MKKLIVLLVALLLTSCGWPDYHWGTVIGLTYDTGAMGCFGDIPYATIQLDDGRITTKCYQAPIGTRVQVCRADTCNKDSIRPDPNPGEVK